MPIILELCKGSHLYHGSLFVTVHVAMVLSSLPRRNIKTLRAAGKEEELLHEMDRYKWSILGLCEMKWKKSGEIPTDGGHRVYFSGKKDKHEQGLGFLVHKE